MNRYRIATATNGELHISSVVLSADEAAEHLQVEETMHRLAGWETAMISSHAWRFPELLCSRAGATRTIRVQTSTPSDDRVT